MRAHKRKRLHGISCAMVEQRAGSREHKLGIDQKRTHNTFGRWMDPSPRKKTKAQKTAETAETTLLAGM